MNDFEHLHTRRSGIAAMRGIIAHATQVLPFAQAVMSRVVWDVADAPGKGADDQRTVVAGASLDSTTGALLCSPTTNSTRMKATRTAAIPKICERLIGGIMRLV